MHKVRLARIQAGLSQDELAEKANVSQHTISEVELGRRRPQGKTLRKLATALEVSIPDLIGEVEQNPKVSAPPSLEWALAAPDEEFDSWVEAANLQDILTLNYELSEATAREPFGSERHRFMWRRLDEVIGRFRKIGGRLTEPAASKKRRARRAQKDVEDAASEAG
ncbi:MAG: helix-turn-helix domain-containing protein [Actinomycetota bacterium]|nr:helix-turn-helix domain-containing protein [Actinomycetota bacterium]